MHARWDPCIRTHSGRVVKYYVRSRLNFEYMYIYIDSPTFSERRACSSYKNKASNIQPTDQ